MFCGKNLHDITLLQMWAHATAAVSKTWCRVFCAVIWPVSSTMQIVSEHGLRTPSEEITFTARPKIKSQSQIFRYGWSIFCLPYRPKISDFFDLCLHWVSVVRVSEYWVEVFHCKFLATLKGDIKLVSCLFERSMETVRSPKKHLLVLC